MVASLEQRINALTSAQLWVGRIKSLATGRPISEFVLADNPPQVNRLLIIERGNGRLIADWKRDATPDERADLLSAMVAAILEFSVQALAGEGQSANAGFRGPPRSRCALRPASSWRRSAWVRCARRTMPGSIRCSSMQSSASTAVRTAMPSMLLRWRRDRDR